MKIPDQVLHVGDLVRVTKNWWPNFQGGEIGLVTLARCDKVCVKGGIVGRSPEEGGPVHAWEQCVVAMFSDKAHRVSTFQDRYDIVGEVNS